jgi:hypothetical protein
VLGQRGVRGKKDDVGIAKHLDRGERTIPERQHREGEIELGGFDLLEQSPVRSIVDQQDVDLGPFVGKPLQERWDNARPDTREYPQTQRPDGAALERTQISIGRLGAGKHRRSVPQHQPPRLRQGCLAGTRPPLYKPRLE